MASSFTIDDFGGNGYLYQRCNGNQVIPAYDRALMQYADTLKKSGNSLPELLKLTHSRSYFKVWNEKGPCYPFYRQSYSLWATPLIENVAPYSSIENISVQILTPESKIGMELLVKTKTPPTKASEV
ncbi:hypothetical protein FXO37_34425 [Capsicum annuum]|nr:hypothetical protein FXO37_34425 [Capsicum annuum]